ncbi:MAG: hypothetical protein HWD81_05090 [Marivivens sp.]|nr:hypothetical protein [Marivivens sp.]
MTDDKHHKILKSEDYKPFIVSALKLAGRAENWSFSEESEPSFTVFLTPNQKQTYLDLGYIDEDKGAEYALSPKGVAEAISVIIDFAQQREQVSVIKEHVLDLYRLLERHLNAEVLNECVGSISDILGDKSFESLQLRKSKLERAIQSYLDRLIAPVVI